MRSALSMFLLLAACDPSPVCNVHPRDVIGAHILAAGEGAIEVPADDAVTRSFLAEMDTSTADVEAFYTVVSTTGPVAVERVDCDDTSVVVEGMSSELERLQPLEVACEGSCAVELCVRVTNAGADSITVDDAVTISFTETLECGEEARNLQQAPLFALDVVTID